MFNHALVVARKEIRDHLRDSRSLIASAFYALMGPLVVGMVSFAVRGEKSSAVLAAMLSVFALVAVFVGGMNVAIDSIAGERERRSLLPLLMNPLPRRDVVIGKWLAIGFFAAVGLLLNLAGFAILLKTPPYALAAFAITLIPLAAFAAALELVISAGCANIKEAHTYLSLAIFLPMGAGMFLVFFPHMASTLLFIPVAGQHFVIDAITKSGQLPLFALTAVTLTTAASAAALLAIAGKLLERDDVVYGG